MLQQEWQVVDLTEGDSAVCRSCQTDTTLSLKPVDIHTPTYSFVQEEKPDVLVVNTKGVVTSYSNHPELLGKVLFWEEDTSYEDAVETYELVPSKINGTADSWTLQVDQTQEPMKQFLENFIVKNT